MYLNAVVLWTCVVVCFVISEVRSKRFTSPERLFSEEPNILDEYFHTTQDERHERSTSEEEYESRRRFRRNSPPIGPIRQRLTDPEITKSKPLCDHNRLVIRWTDSGLVSQTGVIVALCREDSPSTTRRHNASVYVSDDFGLNWRNLSGDFSKLLGKRATIDMYYLNPDTPNNIFFTDKINKKIFYTTDGAKTMRMAAKVTFAPDDISVNRGLPKLVLASYTATSSSSGKDVTRLAISKDGGASFNILGFVDVKAFYWGMTEYGDRATDLFLEAKNQAGENVQGYKLDCSATAKTSTCTIAATLTKGSLLAGDITDFLVKGAYMFATRDNQAKTGVDLYVKYKRTGTWKKATVTTTRPIQEVFVYDVSGGHVMLVCNLRKNETNLYNSFDITGSNYSLSLPRVLYHNPYTEVSSHWLRSAVRYRFVDIWRASGLPSVYFATQLTVGPVGGRYLISKMTFDKGGVWKRIRGPAVNKYNRPCHYPICSLHVNLLYGSIYRYSRTSPLLSRASAPGLIMATGVLGTNLKITPSTFLSRDGGQSFKMVLRNKRRYNFGDQGGFVLASDYHASSNIQYSVDFENFNYVALTNETVAIKMILTEPGEKGTVFLVVGSIRGFYHIFQVNATRTLEKPCTDDDFYKMNLTDVGIGGCAIQQVQVRNASRVCVTGKAHKTVESTTYENCKCRRRHYTCDVMFTPDERGSCVPVTGAQLIPSNCPEGTTFRKSQGYFKLPEYRTCTEDDFTRNTLSPVVVPCPVELLQLRNVTTTPPMKNGLVTIGLGQSLRVEVRLKNGHLPHIDFMYLLGADKVQGQGKNFTSAVFEINKVGSSVIHIKVSNAKSNIYYSVHLMVLRQLNDASLKIVSYPPAPSIKEKVALMVQMSSKNDLSEYGGSLSYQWMVEIFQPIQRIVLRTTTVVPTLYTMFNSSQFTRVHVTVSNGISSVKNTTDVTVTRDLQPKNVSLSFDDPILTVQWREVKEPNVQRYRVFYRKDNGDFIEASCRPRRTETRCEIRNVAYYTVYYVKVDTVLPHEFGPASITKRYKIPSGKPGLPQQVNLANVGAVKLEASWAPPLVPNGKLVGYKYKFYKSGDTPVIKGIITDLSISFDKLDADVDYLFEVAAVNEKYVGDFSTALSARTGVDTPTLPPTEFRIINRTATSVEIEWTPPLLKNGSTLYFSPKSYKIYMRDKDGRMQPYGSTRINRYTFTKLTPDTWYTIGVAAVAAQEGPMSIFEFSTLNGRPAAPTNLKATEIAARKATLSWSPAGSASKAMHYNLYQISPKTTLQPWSVVGTTQKRVTELMPFTEYTFVVTARNELFESLQSKNVTFATLQDKPGRPFHIRPVTLWPHSSSFNISWEPPLQPNGVITKYTVKWFSDKNHKVTEQTDVLGKQWLQIDHLKQKTMYVFGVAAWTKIGMGDARYDHATTDQYAFGCQPITVRFEESSDVDQLLAPKKNFKKTFINTVAKIAGIDEIRIADVRFDSDNNAVVFELISKKDLQGTDSTQILAEMDQIKAKLQPSFTVLGAKTKDNGVTSGNTHSGKTAASSGGSGGSASKALIVGLVCAAVIVILIVVLAMMFFRYRRKSLYNKFDNNFQYNHDDDTVRYEGSPEVELTAPSHKRRHKDIETVPLADADELT